MFVCILMLVFIVYVVFDVFWGVFGWVYGDEMYCVWVVHMEDLWGRKRVVASLPLFGGVAIGGNIDE